MYFLYYPYVPSVGFGEACAGAHSSNRKAVHCLMNEKIIDIILYLVNEIRQDKPIELIDVSELSDDGYTVAEIGAAFSWLVDRSSGPLSAAEDRSRTSFRILHESERELFTSEAYGYVIQLLEIGLLSGIELETIINRAQVAGLYALTIADVKAMASVLLIESGEIGFGSGRMMLYSHDMVH